MPDHLDEKIIDYKKVSYLFSYNANANLVVMLMFSKNVLPIVPFLCIDKLCTIKYNKHSKYI